MEFWGTQFLGLLVGIAASFIANILWERRKNGEDFDEKWKTRFNSTNSDEREKAFRECIVRCLRWYLLGNVMWVISGAAWALEAVGYEGYLVSRIALFISSVLAMSMFGIALLWLHRYLKWAHA